ncbi:MAG: hypothetical protein P8Y62_02900 [candidate division WOR-3 bacterium]|jgi:hypothetical protein
MFYRSLKYLCLLLIISTLTCTRKTPKTLESKVTDKIHELNGSNKDPESFAAPEGEPLHLYPPKLKLIEVSSDTAYLEVINSYYLTQSMGSAGAEEYITKSGISILEIEGINYVDFNFEMGDHAYPGTFSKAGYTLREE